MRKYLTSEQWWPFKTRYKKTKAMKGRLASLITYRLLKSSTLPKDTINTTESKLTIRKQGISAYITEWIDIQIYTAFTPTIYKKITNSSPCKYLRSHTGKSIQASSEREIDDLVHQGLGNANEGSNKMPTEWKLIEQKNL